MVKYLTNEEKLKTRTIWENIFEEDTQEFLDYYYTRKIKDNKILCKYVDGNMISMLHLNPYKIRINNKLYESYYFVAVATYEHHRKKGYMRELIFEALNQMNVEKVPFTFLRPAKEEIYLPFDFRYIYDHKYFDFDSDKFIMASIDNPNLLEISKFINDFLKKRYDVYCERDEEYIKTILEEVRSEHGDIAEVFDNDKFLGYCIYWGKDKTKRAVFIEEKYTILNKITPLVMARIVNVKAFFEILKFETNIDVSIKITDDIIKENNGIFSIYTKDEIPTTSFISIVDYTSQCYKFDIELSISDLTSVIFGYKNISDYTFDTKIIKQFSKLSLPSRVFIDEEV